MTKTTNGKAFEYACLCSIQNILKNNNQLCNVLQTPQFKTAKKDYNNLTSEEKTSYYKAAEAGIRMVCELEPKLSNADINEVLELTLQSDKSGQNGDVRDVVCIRNKDKWDVGISCKHNHFALKHQRLSNKIDFGKEWFGKNCSKEYMRNISNLFESLPINETWDDYEKKEKKSKEDIYVKVLDYFIDELKRLDSTYPGKIPALLTKYLIGSNNFYKVIDDEKENITLVKPFNLYGSLNKAFKTKTSLIKIKKPKLPTVFYNIAFKKTTDKKGITQSSKTTIIVTCNEGWTFSLRIHNAKKEIERSLKFDAELISSPEDMVTILAPWN